MLDAVGHSLALGERVAESNRNINEPNIRCERGEDDNKFGGKSKPYT